MDVEVGRAACHGAARHCERSRVLSAPHDGFSYVGRLGTAGPTCTLLTDKVGRGARHHRASLLGLVAQIEYGRRGRRPSLRNAQVCSGNGRVRGLADRNDELVAIGATRPIAPHSQYQLERDNLERLEAQLELAVPERQRALFLFHQVCLDGALHGQRRRELARAVRVVSLV